MITNEFNDSTLKKIENLSAKDIIRIFEKIGSEPLPNNESAKKISTVIHEELNRYGVMEESLPVKGDYTVATDEVYGRYPIKEIKTFEYQVQSALILVA